MNQFLEEQYKNLGISREVYEFGEKIEESLKERFAEIDARAEYNQMKVIKAGADVDWYVKAEDIVLKNKGNQNAGNPQNHVPQGQMKK